MATPFLIILFSNLYQSERLQSYSDLAKTMGATVQQINFRVLKNLNYNVGVLDGLCGERTIHAIELFQRAFFGHIKPDGLVEPNKLTWKKLCGENLNTVEDTSLLTTLVDKPKKGAINVGLVAVDNVLMLSLLGNPRESYTEKDQPITNTLDI